MENLNTSSLATDQQNLSIPEELRYSAEKILSYAGIPQEKADLFQANLEIFSNMKDKSFTDTASRQIREQLTAVFYESYTSVLKRVLAENNHSRLMQMFLRFAYMDERLLDAQQVNTLYKLVDQVTDNTNYSVYNFQSWLDNIYRITKEPSVNEFGQDYQDLFLEKKRKRELTDKDKPVYDADIDARLKHEVDNLFKIGQRLTYGQSGGYFPILHQEMISRDLESALVTPAKLEASLNKILAVDFSAFHRELVFPHTTQNLAPELIMKPILPDFILMPGFGHRAVMWQMLSGRSKNSPGRLVFPIFTDENLDNLMIDVVAKFRWDLSKNMSGSVINKVNESSLFVDYSDYIQFYAKDRDLSVEAKEKLKTVIKRNRNNPREIFSLDYHTWINYESNGMMRLNKVAREILFKHCPFSKSIRVNLQASPSYSPLISKFDKARAKHCRILEARYEKLRSANNSVNPDLLENLVYYNS